MAIETFRVFGSHMFLVHHLFFAGILEEAALVMANGAILLLDSAGPHKKGRLEHASLEKGLYLSLTGALNEIIMAAATAHPPLFKHLMGDLFLIRPFRFLDRLGG